MTQDLRDVGQPPRNVPTVSQPEEAPRPGPSIQGPRLHVATYLPLLSFTQTFGFMSLNMRVYAAARESKGFIAGGIRAKWWRKQFWTYSVWESRQAMEAFVKRPPHSLAAARINEFVDAGACYVEWEGEEPAEWADIAARLETPTRYFTLPKIPNF